MLVLNAGSRTNFIIASFQRLFFLILEMTENTLKYCMDKQRSKQKYKQKTLRLCVFLFFYSTTVTRESQIPAWLCEIQECSPFCWVIATWDVHLWEINENSWAPATSGYYLQKGGLKVSRKWKFRYTYRGGTRGKGWQIQMHLKVHNNIMAIKIICSKENEKHCGNTEIYMTTTQ